MSDFRNSPATVFTAPVSSNSVPTTVFNYAVTETRAQSNQTYIAVEDLVSLREGVRRVLAKPTAQSQSCIFEEARDKGEDRSVLDTLTRIDCKVRGEVPVLISVYSSSMKKAQLSNMLPPLSNKIPSLSSVIITDSLSPLPSQSCLHVKLNQVTLATMADVNENISPLSLLVRFHNYIMQNVD